MLLHVFIATASAVVTVVTAGSSLRTKVGDLERGMEDLGRRMETLDEKMASSLKKMKKQMKKEMRVKVVPKMLKSMEPQMEIKAENAAAKNAKFVGQVLDVMEKKLKKLEERIFHVEEENMALKESLKTTQDEHLSYLKTMTEALAGNCSCYIGVPSRRTSAASLPVKRTQFSTFGDADDEIIVPSAPSKSSRKVKTKVNKRRKTVLPPWVTFNVSADMPTFDKQASLLITVTEGDMVRVGLEKPAVRGTIKTNNFVETIAYDPVSKLLFWACNKNPNSNSTSKYVFSAGLDGSDLSLLDEGKWIIHLVVDGERQLVFMSDWTSHLVSVMATDGSSYRVVRDRIYDTNKPKLIVLDSRKERLYVSFAFAIFSMRYDGSDLQKLTDGQWMKPMAIHHASGFLYYTDDRNLFRVDLSSMKKVVVNQLKHAANALVFHDKRLYISYQKANANIDVLTLEDRSVRQFVYFPGEGFRMSLIPAA